MALHDISIGADPELFCFDTATKQYVSAHSFLKGSKEEPFGVNRGAVQVDGTAAEFNIEPAHTLPEFQRNISTVMHQLAQMVPNSIELQAVPFVKYPATYFNGLPYECQLSGCDPDFDAWNSGQMNPRPIVPEGLCAAGGHVHVGWTKGVKEGDIIHRGRCHQMARQLDYTLGLASFQWDDDTTRRQLYGRAGSLRYKSYGVEYRTLSNTWLRDRASIVAVWEGVHLAVDLINKGIFLENYYADQAQKIINSGDRTAALDLYSDIKKEKYNAVS